LTCIPKAIAHVTSPRSRKVIRWSLGVFAGLLMLLVAAVWVAQWLIDTPSFRADLSQKLSAAVNGKVTWSGLDFRVLPRPHAVVRDAYFEMPNIVKVEVANVDVTLRLLPLFRGRAELQSIDILQPQVDVWIADSSTDTTPEDEAPTSNNPLVIYRQVMQPVLDGVARFAPDTALNIDDGRVALHITDLPAFEASGLDLKLRTDNDGVTVDAAASGTYWNKLVLNGRVEYVDLSAKVKLDAEGLKPQPVLEGLLTNIREALVLSEVGAVLVAHTDGKTSINADLDLDLPKVELQRRGKRFDIVKVRVGGTVKFSDKSSEPELDVVLNKIQLGDLVPTANGQLRVTGANREPYVALAVDTLDLNKLRDAITILTGDALAANEYLARIRGGQLRNLTFTTQAPTFAELFSLPRMQGSVAVMDGRMLIPAVELEASQIAAQVELIKGALKATDVSARLGASQLRQASADILFDEPMRLANTRAQATLRLDDLLPNLRQRATFAEVLTAVPQLAGTVNVNVNNLALRFDRPAQVIYDIKVNPQRVTLQADQLPAAVNLRGGSVRIRPNAITFDRIGVETFASKAVVSGELTEFTTAHPRVSASVSNGIVDSKLVDWIWQRADIAPQFKPVTPIELTAQRVQWRDNSLDVNAKARFTPGSSLDIDLALRDKALIVRNAVIKDRDSNATITFGMRDSLLDVGFSGALFDRTVAEIFGHSPDPYTGRMRGDFRLTIDREFKGRTTMHGTLAGEDFKVDNVFALPITVARLDLSADGNKLDLRELHMDWAKQKIVLAGGIAQQGKDIVLDLDLQSPGVDLNAILRAANKNTSDKTASEKSATKPTTDHLPPEQVTPKMSERLNTLWALPLLGRVGIQAGFVEYENYRVEGLRAVANLRADSATIGITEGAVCGVHLPLTINATTDKFDASLQLSAKDQSLGAIAECLRSEHVNLTGQLDLNATLATRGAIDTIAESARSNLTGSVELKAREGEIRKLALLGNILSLKAVGDMLKGDVKLSDKGFKYRELTARAKIANGVVKIEQGSLDSPALGIATTGDIQLANYETRLSVLVAPFSGLDRTARKIPIVGYVIGGAFTSIPVGVSGDIRNPRVVPLGPGAIGSEVLGIFERTFKLPGKMIEPLSKPKEDK
jgi:hypothetical protein